MTAPRARLLLTRRWPAAVEAALAERHDVTVDPDDSKLSKAALCAAMREFDILCPTVSDRIDAEVLETPGATVRLVANYGAGIDHIDLAAARRAGIPVTNTPDVLTEATADLAILLMLMTSRRAGEAERELRGGRWTGWRPTHLLGQSLSGKRLGLVGLGRIGRATARRARLAFGMEIAYFSRSPAPAEVETELAAERAATLDDLAATADVLSLHCQGGPETHHLVARRLLGLMKPAAILINTARGSVVNEADLAEALANGTIAGAGLDVFEHEPAVNPALLALENVVLLPHIGSATAGARVAMGMRVAANIDSFLAGEALPDHVA